MWEQWRALGGKIGVREWDVKCAVALGKEVPAPAASEPANGAAVKEIEPSTVASEDPVAKASPAEAL